MRPAAGPALDHRSRRPRARRAGLGHRARRDSAGRATRRSRSWRPSTAARSRGCSRSASIRWSRCPTPTSRARRWRSWSSSASIDFFLSETAQHADVVLAGSLQEEEEGVAGSAEGRVIHIQQGGRPAGQRARGLRSICDLARRLGKGQYFPYQRAARDLRRAARGVARRHRRLLRHHLREDRPADGRLLALPDARTIPARRACSRAAGSSTPTARRASWSTEWRDERRSGGRRLSRSTSPPAAWSASTSPARRRGASARWSISTPSRSWRSTRGWRSSTASRPATG